MTTELIAFLVMVGVFLARLLPLQAAGQPVDVLASVAGAIAGGRGLRFATWSKVCLPMSTQSWSLPRR